MAERFRPVCPRGSSQVPPRSRFLLRNPLTRPTLPPTF
ncbi:hypothetical protein STVIR_0663 [Streptomyces viridochromogenes Tue57]|uniref:Uncharacterized protein n=1 Tax=Streptomyces viridochromogenes Tue57 TaxID=1160705 RepID=L8PSG7_STRVR|nr:hypothetical protein STVIR_0663 [Streptomyces viridochromogenes Tue57]